MAKSIPAPFARFNISGIPAYTSLTSQPASAIKFAASATSLALKDVVAPIPLMYSSTFFKSSPTTPDVAENCAIDCSKSVPKLITDLPNAAIGTVSAAVNAVPAPNNLVPTPVHLFSTLLTTSSDVSATSFKPRCASSVLAVTFKTKLPKSKLPLIINQLLSSFPS